MTMRTTSDTISKTSENEKNDLPHKPKEKFGTRHLQVLLMSLSLTIGYAINLSLPVAMIAMTDVKAAQTNFKYYEWTTSEMSLVLSSFMWGYAAWQIPSGYLAKIWSARKLFSLGLFISSIINLLLPFATFYGDWMALCIGRAIIGLCHATFSSCTHTLLSKWAPPGERSRMSSFVTTGSVLGGVLAMSLSGVIAASSLGWPGIFYIFGSLGVASSFIFFYFVFDSPSRHKKICPFEKAFILNSFQQIANHSEIDRKQPPWKQIFSSKAVWALIIAECGATWGQWSVNTGMPTYMKYVLNYNIAANGLFSTLPYLANWLLSFPFSWMADYAMRKKVSLIAIRRASNSVGLWGPAIMLVALCYVNTENRIIPVTLLVLSVGLKAGTSSGYIVNLIDLSPNFAGTIYSIVTCFGSVVSILAPIASGQIVEDMTNTVQWHIVFYTTAFVYFFTNLIFIILSKGEIQSWNNPIKNKESISTIYDPKTVKQIP